MPTFLLLLFYLLFSNERTANAQFSLPSGARIFGMGNASVAVPDAFSIFLNPASMVEVPNRIALNVDHRYNLAGLNTLAAAYQQSFGISVGGIGISRYGDELLNYSRVEVGLARKIRMVSLGMGGGYHQIMVAENGTARNFLLQFGGTAEIGPRLTYGAHVFNVLRSKLSKESPLYYPVIMRMGIAYVPIKQVILAMDVEKDSRYRPSLKVGLEYVMVERISIRTGINSNPSNGFFGLGLLLKEWQLDYGLSFHSRLGLVHSVGLVFRIYSGRGTAEMERPSPN